MWTNRDEQKIRKWNNFWVNMLTSEKSHEKSQTGPKFIFNN